MDKVANTIGTKIRIVEVVNGRSELEGQYGTIVDIVSLAADLFGIECETPEILLDSGQTIYGHECWWVEATRVPEH